MADLKPPLALIVQGREPVEVVAYACGTCGVVCRGESEASRHCDPRCACGAQVSRRYGTMCDPCQALEDAARNEERDRKEQECLSRSKRVLFADYEGRYLYTTAVNGNRDGYFEELEDLFEACEDDETEPPTLVWACNPVRMSFDADSIIENALDDMHEDAGDEIGLEERKELQTFLDGWCAKHSPTSYQPGAEAVDISAEVEAWKREREGEAAASQLP